jgi:serine/threonine protein kinase
MITQQNDFGVIKIMDFGLSKILSPNEKMVDGYGTLSYVAPEVLLRTPYNKEVDIWSMGVILFYMLSGKLPFRGRKEQEVAEKIVYSDLEFDEDDWEIRSQSVQDLITRCMEKDAQKRITIDENNPHLIIKNNRLVSVKKVKKEVMTRLNEVTRQALIDTAFSTTELEYEVTPTSVLVYLPHKRVLKILLPGKTTAKKATQAADIAEHVKYLLEDLIRRYGSSLIDFSL